MYNQLSIQHLLKDGSQHLCLTYVRYNLFHNKI